MLIATTQTVTMTEVHVVDLEVGLVIRYLKFSSVGWSR